ncbi:heme-binding protein [Rhizobium sp. CNPSo 3464]|uniref:heme-binding protein n=1 Tax=Rhizobium sp. CNPSo 3464 TaxID=3021406 RepID=UPI00254AC2BF|nr:heme-binding protein [Rhizobium sp. CNPSo 3464]MDK4740381.1 heme-binding protein [Rhizobium sp. CNPSo 3464]
MNEIQPSPLHMRGLTTLRRVAPSQRVTADRLGALADLPGFWEGTGFSLIARPDYSGRSENGFYLQLNLLHETIEFTSIGSPVFNRGSEQGDIAIYGVTYLHRVTDGTNGGALHIEPGMWLTIPATTAPKADASIARLGTIPHGNAFCTVGFVQHAEFNKVPEIPPANTIPFPIDGKPPEPGSKNPYPEYDLAIPSQFRTNPVPAGIVQAMIDDPNQVLRDTLNHQVFEQGQTLKQITRLITSTAGGIANIPFITTNANTLDLDSVFAIETVVDALGNEFLQLQYSQTGLLNFKGKSFPHVTVGTLIKAF